MAGSIALLDSLSATVSATTKPTAKTPNMPFEWKTPPKAWSDLIQVTDGYVVHARGFTVGYDVWFDEYALKLEHKAWWETDLKPIYGGSWPDDPPADALYWSVTGTPTFVMQHPTYNATTDAQHALLKEFLTEWQVPGDTQLHWENGEALHVTTVEEYLATP